MVIARSSDRRIILSLGNWAPHASLAACLATVLGAAFDVAPIPWSPAPVPGVDSVVVSMTGPTTARAHASWVNPRSAACRCWSRYRFVSEWFRDYQGYVPIEIAVGLDRLMRATLGMAFPDIYVRLLPSDHKP